ncbi:PREDICTED: bicaudal D-related protein homolog [Diuraphis noxia]|uniref:bicaudal D-related protein homolog n=1 Tax=Diuraphis noxia TaxID=143948 RepID=UPI000763B0B8|nr:PREDICTED: bicaudal D-related protein homolog [Diuraphis noxia]
MAAAVATTTPPTTDNRCVGGGESSVATMRHQTVVPLPSSDIPALTSSGRRQRRRRLDGNDSNPQVSRSSTSSCSSSTVSSSDDDGDGDNDGGHSGMDGVEAEFGGRGVVGVQPPPVAAKRLKDLQQHLVDLDDLELLDRHLAVESAPGNSLHDSALDGGATGMVAEELRQKNKDLVLAARLGKALLAKNDELSLMNERLAEEYGDKLEEIEQDRHRLRRQLAQARAECEQRCHELQADLKDLQAVLDSRERQLREADKQKRAVVRELTDQNGRLQSHIRELSQAEAELRHKCRLLEDAQQPQHGSGKWTGIGGVGSPASITNGGSTTDYGSLTPDDYRSLDVLRDEIDMKAAEKQRLQKRMAELRADRDRLAELLELKDRQLAECRAEANHYEHRSAMLAKQLDDALCSGGAGDWRGRGGKCASCNNAGGALAASRTNGSGGTESQPMSLLAELEQAEAASTQMAACPPPPMVDVDLTEHRPNDPNDFGTDAERLMTRLCDALERRAGQANAVSPELSASTRYRLLKLMGCSGDGSAATGVKSTGAVDLAELVRNRDGRVAELTCELSVRDAELQAAREERDLAVRDKMDAMRIQCVRCGNTGSGEAADATSGSGTDEKDASLIPELLRKAWEQRDGAVRRKNAVQVQLARTRVDVLQANGQLMEAIGQKVELSQQLEQWQMDMQALLDEQMRRKLLAPPAQSSAAGTSEFGGGNQQKISSAGGFPSMSASSLGSLGSSGLMNSLLMIAGGGGNANR